nr:hypothetical protein [Providencia rettgeri]
MKKEVKENMILKWYLLIFLLLLLLKFISLFPYFDLMYKALKLMFGNVFLIVFYALFFSIVSSSKRKSSIILVIVLTITLTIINNISVASISRFSFIQLLILGLIAIFARFQKNLNFSFSMFFLIIAVVICISGYITYIDFRTGGDSLIFKGTTEIIDYIDSSENYQPFMPFFNGGFILIPDEIWNLIEQKPKAFNSSAFYIENIMNMDSSIYPWGVGISSFGSGYIYGGYIGLSLLFSILAIVYAKFRNMAENPFSFGVIIYLNVLLVFAMIRMDETFIFGAWLFSIPILLFFINHFKSLFNEN